MRAVEGWGSVTTWLSTWSLPSNNSYSSLSLSFFLLPSSSSPRASFFPHPIHRCHSLIPRFFVGSPAYRVHIPARAPISHAGTHVSLLGCSFVRSRFLSPLLVIERRKIQRKASSCIYIYMCTRDWFLRGFFEYDYVRRFSETNEPISLCIIVRLKYIRINVLRLCALRNPEYSNIQRSKVRSLAKVTCDRALKDGEKSLFFVSPFITVGDK